MVLNYYKLREQPFGVTPDPLYLYAGDTHREALASLLYGIEAGRGFVALIAKPGMGKTTLLFSVLTELKDRARTVFLFQTMYTPADLMRALLTDLGVQEVQGTLTELQSKFDDVLTEQFSSGKPLVIVIDEAQNLDNSVLELVRTLSNFETSREKLLQIVLSGQPQLATRLASPELLQLRQRLSIFARLKPFSPEETALYINHRLRMAGYRLGPPLFTAAALAMIADRSEGIPRNINNLCFNALSLGCALKRTSIGCDVVSETIADLDLESLQEREPVLCSPCRALPRLCSELPRAFRKIKACKVKIFPHAGYPKGQSVAPKIVLSALASRKRIAMKGDPSFSSTRRISSITSWRPPKHALAFAVLLALGGAFFQSHKWAASRFTVSADRVVPYLSAALGPAFGVKAVSHRSAPQGTMPVTPWIASSWFCADSARGCHSDRFGVIQRLNLALSNSDDYIESRERGPAPVAQELFGVREEPGGELRNTSPILRELK